MEDNKAARRIDEIPSSVLKPRPGRRSERRMRNAIPTVSPSVQASAAQHADLELGDPKNNEGAVAGYPKLAALWSEDENRNFNFMVFRRFGWFHTRLLLHKQTEKERELERMGTPTVLPRHAATYQGLLNIIEEEFPYDSIVDSIVRQWYPSMQIATSNVRQRYKTVGQLLEYGPDIHMNFDQIEKLSWLKYETAVKDFLRDKGATFLEYPFDQSWINEPHEEGLNNLKRFLMVVDARTKNKFGLLLSLSMGVVFWTGHITAALGFVLVANISGSDAHPTVEL
ncbi:MAG: hypothetical protein Q9223_002343 [Gallowayella weberi]